MKELIYRTSITRPSVFGEFPMRSPSGGERPGLYENLVDLNQLVKELDPTRLTTMAQLSMLSKDSSQNQITDVVSYNLYFGWYGGSYTMNEEWFDEFHRMHPDRPFGVSEYGCEGIISWHSDTPKCKDYSEEYQAEYHEHMAKIIEERPYLWATHVWNMLILAVMPEMKAVSKEETTKGLSPWTERSRKMLTMCIRLIGSKDPVCLYTGRRYAKRPYDTMTVKVYSNQSQVTLTVNGKEVETKCADKIFLFEDVKLDETVNCVTASAEGCPSDTVTWIRTEQPDSCYVMPVEEEDDREGVKNWFDEADGDEQLPELTFEEGYTVSGILWPIS